MSVPAHHEPPSTIRKGTRAVYCGEGSGEDAEVVCEETDEESVPELVTLYHGRWKRGAMGLHIVLAIAIAGSVLFRSDTLPAEEPTVRIISWICTEEGRAITVRGVIQNLTKSVQHPSLVVMFKSLKGGMITHTKGLPVLYPLPPGQESPIELSTQNKRNIASCELVIQDPGSGQIHASRKQDLPYDLPEESGDARKGKSVFNGKGSCNYCHGYLGQIDQIPDETVSEVPKMNPKPSDFKKPRTLRLKTDKQRFRAVKYGIPGTTMAPMTHISDEEIIDALAYIRELGADVR